MKLITDNHLLLVYVKKGIMIPMIVNLIIYVYLCLHIKNMDILNGNGILNLLMLKRKISKKEETLILEIYVVMVTFGSETILF